MVDLRVVELHRRFSQPQPGINKLLVIERVLTVTVQPDDTDVISCEFIFCLHYFYHH